MDASDEGRAYVNVNQEAKRVSAVDTSEASLWTYRLVAVSFGVLCVLQVTLNVTLRLYVSANTKSDVQTNISLLVEEKDQLQVSYTELLMDSKELQKKLEEAQWKLSEICVNVSFTTGKDSQQNVVDNLRQQLSYTQHTLSMEVSRRQDVESALRKKHRENAQLQNEINILRARETEGGKVRV